MGEDTVTARGLLMPMPTMAALTMVAMPVDTDTVTARGLLMPRLTTATVDTEDTVTARGLPTPMPTMAAVTMAAMATVMARGLLTPRLTMVAMPVAMDTVTESNHTMEANNSTKRPFPFETDSKPIRLKSCTIFP